MPRHQGPKGSKAKKTGKPVRAAAGPEAPAELQPVLREMSRLAQESPEGWGTIAEVFKQNPELEAEVILPFLTRSLGKEVLPLLRGAALDEDELLAHAALHALPLLGTRAAGEALAEAYSMYPEGERARLAWEGVQALQAQGINVTVPEPDGVRQVVPQFLLRETWETLPDGVGSRTTYARGQDRYGVWLAAAVLWNDQSGVKDGFPAVISRAHWDELREESRNEGVVLVKVPAEYARWQVSRVRRLNEQTGLPLEDHLDAWDQAVEPAPEDYQPPDPTERLRALPPEERAKLAEHTDCLFETDGFQNWALEPADCRAWYEEWEQLYEDEAAPDSAFESARDALVARAATDLVKPRLRELYRERLLDTARKLEWLGWEHERDIAAAVVLAIEEAGEPGEVRFFRDLVENGLLMLEQMLDEGEDPEKWRYDPMKPAPEE